MTTPTTLYATDEDIALRAPADFPLLCPKHQRLAAGTDGTFTVSDRWTLRSPSVDFAASGLAPGHVVQLLGPTTAFRAPGDLLAVAAVEQGALLLRRLGQPAGVGAPPAPPGGVSGVEFLAVTLDPQIATACADLDRRFGIDARVATGTPENLADRRTLRDVTVLTVLHRRYLALGRGPAGRDDPLTAKAVMVASELADVLARSVVRWLDPGAHSSRFHIRLSR